MKKQVERTLCDFGDNDHEAAVVCERCGKDACHRHGGVFTRDSGIWVLHPALEPTPRFTLCDECAAAMLESIRSGTKQQRA